MFHHKWCFWGHSSLYTHSSHSLVRPYPGYRPQAGAGFDSPPSPPTGPSSQACSVLLADRLQHNTGWALHCTTHRGCHAIVSRGTIQLLQNTSWQDMSCSPWQVCGTLVNPSSPTTAPSILMPPDTCRHGSALG